MNRETKNERFKRVAEKRVQRILESIRVLSNCSNQRTYEWTDEDIRKIWTIIDKELRTCKAKFSKIESKKFRL